MRSGRCWLWSEAGFRTRRQRGIRQPQSGTVLAPASLPASSHAVSGEPVAGVGPVVAGQIGLRLSGRRSGQALPVPPTCLTLRIGASVPPMGAGGSAGLLTIARSSFGPRASPAGGLVRPAPGRSPRIRRGRTGPGSSPSPRRPRSRERTSPPRRRMHRLQRSRAAGSSTRRPDRPGWQSI